MISEEQMNEIKAEIEPAFKVIAKCIVLKAVVPILKDEVSTQRKDSPMHTATHQWTLHTASPDFEVDSRRHGARFELRGRLTAVPGDGSLLRVP